MDCVGEEMGLRDGSTPLPRSGSSDGRGQQADGGLGGERRRCEEGFLVEGRVWCCMDEVTVLDKTRLSAETKRRAEPTMRIQPSTLGKSVGNKTS